MARTFSGGNWLENLTAAPVTAAPLTMACRFRSTSSGTNNTLISIGRNSISNDQFRMRFGSIRQVQATTVVASALSTAESTASAASGVWSHACAVYAATNSKAAFLDGVNKGTDTTTAIPTVDSLVVGAQNNAGSIGNSYNGDLCDVAIWNVALTDAEVAQFSRPISALMVRPQDLIFYAPVLGRYSPEIDLMGGFNLTVQGSLPFADGPGLYMKNNNKLGLWA